MDGRNLEENGRNMVLRVYPELQSHLIGYYRRMAWRRKNRGEDVPPGELKGHSYALGRVLCWLATLSDEDQARIQEEGGALLDQLHAQPADYEGVLPFGQRTESVLIDKCGSKREDDGPRAIGARTIGKPGRPANRTG